ncbi:hypothetical protein [Jiella sp. M17.18]|uniref:hypothetical protein n=1 Tax=Jiella sp. M17.18 TaxID=3234247 RepID=UPI0034E02243
MFEKAILTRTTPEAIDAGLTAGSLCRCIAGSDARYWGEMTIMVEAGGSALRVPLACLEFLAPHAV